MAWLHARRKVVLAATALAAATGGCGGGGTVEGPPPAAPAALRLTSPAFGDGAAIPARYTCSGDGVSPPLAWRGVPRTARSLALVVEDPDAPGGTFVHWTLFDVAPGVTRLAEGVVPSGARQGENSSGDAKYGGPCPPKGDRPHHYVFVLYALRSPLALDAGAAPDDVLAAIRGRALARGSLTGRFGR